MGKEHPGTNVFIQPVLSKALATNRWQNNTASSKRAVVRSGGILGRLAFLVAKPEVVGVETLCT